MNDFGLTASDDTFVPGITSDPFYVCLGTCISKICVQKEPNVPKRCIGCGALFQSSDSSKPGYVDADVLRDFGGESRGLLESQTYQPAVLQRSPELKASKLIEFRKVSKSIRWSLPM